jgi:UDP-glucose 4-epimerase
MKVLLTGGAGYIGSHTAVEFLTAGFEVVVYDNLSNASDEALNRVRKITGKPFEFIKGDIRDHALLLETFRQYQPAAVVHFAGLKAVGESVAKPVEYYSNNVAGTVTLLQAMQKAGIKQLVFSSSATVYGEPQYLPLTEEHPLSATNPYGRSKLMIEDMLRDLYRSDAAWNIAILRYFNPVGAHVSGLIGEDPNDVPNNLMPFISQTAVGRRDKLSVFGGDYPTPDGTGVRDYIHVVDLALGHVRAIEALRNRSGLLTVNLGTGTGYSVLEMIRAFEQASGKSVPFEIVARRPGDVAACYADPALAAQRLNWKATRTLADMCADTWRWQSQNPQGYRS